MPKPSELELIEAMKADLQQCLVVNQGESAERKTLRIWTLHSRRKL